MPESHTERRIVLLTVSSRCWLVGWLIGLVRELWLSGAIELLLNTNRKPIPEIQ